MVKDRLDIKYKSEVLDNTHLLVIDLLVNGYNRGNFSISGSIALNFCNIINRKIGDIDIEVNTKLHFSEVSKLFTSNGFRKSNLLTPSKYGGYAKTKESTKYQKFKFPFSHTEICLFVNDTPQLPWLATNYEGAKLNISNPMAICKSKIKMLSSYRSTVVTKHNKLQARKHYEDIVCYNNNQFVIDNNLTVDIEDRLKP